MNKKNDTKTLHPRNLHNSRYDFDALIKSELSLKEFVKANKYGDLSIDFSNANAVIALNKALLVHFYDIKNWEIPKEYLCPPIPGRADYIHYLADLLASNNKNKIPKGNNIKVLDVGIGANGIYPIIGRSIYKWSFVGSEIDKISINNIKNIIKNNELKDIEIREQTNNSDIFNNIINENDKFDLTMCNPPFHKSKKDAQQGSNRKVSNLTKKNTKSAKLNFGGQSNELWCKGGEVEFIKTMILQSKTYANNVFWFTSLVSKKENLDIIYKTLKDSGVFETKTINMKQGQKTSRFVAWTFLDRNEQNYWIEHRWLSK